MHIKFFGKNIYNEGKAHKFELKYSTVRFVNTCQFLHRICKSNIKASYQHMIKP